MYPVHDVDAILLLALSLAAKRRPAELVEIIAAADLAQGVIPPEAKLIDSFYRLSAYGLICELEGGYTLTADAQQIMTTGQRKKAVPEKRIFSIKENLADYHLNGENAVILVTEEQVSAAVAAHQAAKITMGRSWLVPKPKPVEDNNKRPGSRKPFPFRAKKK